MCICTPSNRTPICKNCPLPSKPEVTYASVWLKHTGEPLYNVCITDWCELYFDESRCVLEIGEKDEQISYTKCIKGVEHLDKVLEAFIN